MCCPVSGSGNDGNKQLSLMRDGEANPLFEAGEKVFRRRQGRSKSKEREVTRMLDTKKAG